MSTDDCDFSVNNVSDLGDELIEEGVVEDARHDLAPTRPLLSLSERHSLSQESYLVLNEHRFLHIVFLLVEEVL